MALSHNIDRLISGRITPDMAADPHAAILPTPIAGDSFFDHRFGQAPTILAALGVLAMFAASLLLAREASMAVHAVNEEMDDAHRKANRRSPLI